MQHLSNADRFTAGARAYAEIWAPVLLPHGRRLLADLPLSSARRVLEIAAGAGLLLPELHAAAPAAQIVGVDVAHGLLALAPREYGLAVMDAGRLALAEATFDTAVMAFALFLVPEAASALAEAHRVLRPGGRLVVSSWEGEPTFPAQDIWSAETRAAGAPFPRWWPDALAPDTLMAAFERAGFVDVRARLDRFDHQHDPSSFLQLRVAMASTWLATLPEPTRADLLARISYRLAALDPDGFFDPTRILVVSGRRVD
jgi:SAM-dependent methyltransferase